MVGKILRRACIDEDILPAAPHQIDEVFISSRWFQRLHPVNLRTGNPESAGIECLNGILHDSTPAWATAREIAYSVEKHADVAAQADGAKSFADPMNGRLGCGGQESWRDAVPLAGCNQRIHRREKPRVLELRGNAHRHSEIVVAHPGDIHAGQRR